MGLNGPPWAQAVKNLFAMWETWVRSLGWEDPLEEGKATHSNILVWRIFKDRGSWQATVHGVTNSRTQLSEWNGKYVSYLYHWLSEILLAFLLCFPESLSFYANYILQQDGKLHLCKQRWNIYLFLSTWSLQILASPAESSQDLIAYCNSDLCSVVSNSSLSHGV